MYAVSRGATPLVSFLVLLFLVLCLLIGARRFIWAVDEWTGAAFSRGGLEVAVSSFLLLVVFLGPVEIHRIDNEFMLCRSVGAITHGGGCLS